MSDLLFVAKPDAYGPVDGDRWCVYRYPVDTKMRPAVMGANGAWLKYDEGGKVPEGRALMDEAIALHFRDMLDQEHRR